MAFFGFKFASQSAIKQLSMDNVVILQNATMTDINMPDDTKVAKLDEGLYIYQIKNHIYRQFNGIFEIIQNEELATRYRDHLAEIDAYGKRAPI